MSRQDHTEALLSACQAFHFPSKLLPSLFTHHPLFTLSPLGTCSHPALSSSSCGLTSIFILNLFPHIVLCQLPWTALEK